MELYGEGGHFTCWSNDGMTYITPVFHRALQLIMQKRLPEFCNYIQTVITELLQIPSLVADQMDEENYL